jgi:type IV pilus assembly protein PilA
MVLAVVGVLALMAIPVMSEGALRKQVKEGLELATVAKNGVQAFYALAGEFPPDNKAADLPDPDKIVGTMVTRRAGRRRRGDAHVRQQRAARCSRPQDHASSGGRPDQPVVPIAWLCHGANVPKGMIVHGQDRTDLASDMLPVECRATSEPKK